MGKKAVLAMQRTLATAAFLVKTGSVASLPPKTRPRLRPKKASPSKTLARPNDATPEAPLAVVSVHRIVRQGYVAKRGSVVYAPKEQRVVHARPTKAATAVSLAKATVVRAASAKPTALALATEIAKMAIVVRSKTLAQILALLVRAGRSIATVRKIPIVGEPCCA